MISSLKKQCTWLAGAVHLTFPILEGIDTKAKERGEEQQLIENIVFNKKAIIFV